MQITRSHGHPSVTHATIELGALVTLGTARALGTLAAVAILGLSSSLCASGTFYNLGAGNTVSGLSADGSVAAGTNPAQYFVWTPSSGVTFIGGTAAGGGVGGQAKISDAGDRVCGTFLNTVSGFHEFSMYDLGTGTWSPLGGIGGPCSTEISSGWGISGDGMHVVGLGWLTCAGAHAAQWTEGFGPIDLGTTVPGRSTRANAVNFDGTVVAGWQDSSTGFRQGAVWVNGVQSLVKLGLAGGALGEAGDISADGVWAVGSGVAANSNQAWRWSAATGGLSLGAPPPPAQASWRGAATGISADGSKIVGFYRPFPGPATFGNGCFWSQATGLVDLTQYVQSQGAVLPAGTVLALPLDISADGRSFAGVARIGGSIVGFVVTLDAPCPADLDGNGTVDGSDLGELLSNWGGPGLGDLNGDNMVDGSDLGELLAQWGDCV